MYYYGSNDMIPAVVCVVFVFRSLLVFVFLFEAQRLILTILYYYLFALKIGMVLFGDDKSE